MKLFELFNLEETPIGDIHLYGDMSKRGSLRPDDLGIVQSPKGQDKIKRVLQKAPILIDLHFVNLVHPIDDLYSHINDRRKTGFHKFSQVEERYGIHLNFNKNALNLVYLQNEGTQRLPFTPWIIAHRMSHALVSFRGEEHEEFNRLIRIWFNVIDDLRERVSNNHKDVFNDYEDPKRLKHSEEMSLIFGTTKSCRENNLTQRGEWFHECFAQYLVTGDIKFNKFPESIPASNETRDYIDSGFEKLRTILKQGFKKNLETFVGMALVF